MEHTPCPHYKKCGGCQLQSLPYDEQLRLKQRKVIRLLGSFCHVEEIIGMENPTHYRNKVQAAFAADRSGRTISGVFQSKTQRVLPVDDCMTQDAAANEIIVTVRNLLKSFKLKPFDPVSGRGFLRHVLVKRGFASGQIMVVLVTGGAAFPSKRSFVNALLQRHPDITTVVQNISGGSVNLLLGERNEILFGTGKIEEQLCGCTFRISPRAFYQINPVQTEILYRCAIEFSALTGRERVVDAYCGTGTIGILCAPQAGSVLGVERNADAVRDAAENARLNGIDNIRFTAADAGNFLAGMAKAGDNADVVLLDPPRAGCDPKFLQTLAKLAPERIVYVSCNPETMARDLRTLCTNGYRTRKLQPVDMFPHTEHVECVGLLTRRVADTAKKRNEEPKNGM